MNRLIIVVLVVFLLSPLLGCGDGEGQGSLVGGIPGGGWESPARPPSEGPAVADPEETALDRERDPVKESPSIVSLGDRVTIKNIHVVSSLASFSRQNHPEPRRHSQDPGTLLIIAPTIQDPSHILVEYKLPLPIIFIAVNFNNYDDLAWTVTADDDNDAFLALYGSSNAGKVLAIVDTEDSPSLLPAAGKTFHNVVVTVTDGETTDSYTIDVLEIGDEAY